MLKSLLVLALIDLVDSISYMAVAPSLIFYVLQVGGNKEMYGLIMSAFSFASFCGKPVLGYWVDKGGNKFQKPYLFSFVVAIVGALMYFVAVAFNSNPTVALAFIFGGRLLSGLGGANQALGFAYLASTVKLEDQTRTNSLLAIIRIFGMAMGPAVNLLLQKIDTTLTIGSYTVVTIDPLNSVGLLLAFGNALVLVIVLTFLEEPTEKELKHPNATVSGPSVSKRDIWKALLCVEIILPVLTVFVLNSSFQL
jgi:ceroid-lipofuscinosis MFS transporter 7